LSLWNLLETCLGDCVRIVFILVPQDYQRLLASQPTRRLNPAKLAESAALKSKLVDTIAFLESLAVKDSNEKDLFFKRLPSVIPSLPLPVAQRKVLRWL
jgi:SCY1-like protein 1